MGVELFSGRGIRACFWFLPKIDFDIWSLLKDKLLSRAGQLLSGYDVLCGAILIPRSKAQRSSFFHNNWSSVHDGASAE